MFLKFPALKGGKVTLSAQPPGDVANLTVTPPPAVVKAKKTKKC